METLAGLVANLRTISTFLVAEALAGLVANFRTISTFLVAETLAGLVADFADYFDSFSRGNTGRF